MSEKPEKSAEAVLNELLHQIKQTQKQINRKVSVIITRMEAFIFKSPFKLNEDQQFRLLIGSEESDNKGLLYLCGLKHRLQNTFKKSAFAALQLLLRILCEGKQKESFLKIFCDLDEEEFKQLKLSNHIQNTKNHDFCAHKIAMMIKEKRPHLSTGVYIMGKKAQEEFEEWYKEAKAKKNKEDPSTWKEDETSTEKKKLVRRDSIGIMENRKFKKKTRLDLSELDFERNKDYYLRTFRDPLKSLIESIENNDDKNNSRKSLDKKSKIKALFSAKLISKGELTPVIEEKIEQLHIDSPNFDSYVLLITLYNNEAPAFFTKVNEQLVYQQKEIITYNKGLVYFNLPEYFSAERTITQIMKEFIAKEARKDSGSTLELKSSLQTLQLGLSAFADPLIRFKNKGDQIRTVLSLMHKYQFLIETPIKMKQALLQKDLKNLTRIYSKNSTYLKNFSKLPVFSKANEEALAITKELGSRILEFASLKQKKFEKLNDCVQALFALDVTQNPLEFLIEQLCKKLIWRVEKSFRSQIFEENFLKALSKHSFQDKIEKIKMSLSEGIDDLDEEGDLLDKLIVESDQVETKKYNLKKSEVLNKEILLQLENLLIFCKQYKDGIYDYKFKESLSTNDLQSMIENRENMINLTIFSFIEKSLSLYKELLSRIANLIKIEKNNKKYKILKSDLKILSKRLSEFESTLRKFGIKMDELDNFKEEITKMFIFNSSGYMIENALQEIKYEDNCNLFVDFFGRQSSPFLQTVFEILLNEMKDLSALPSFTQLSQKNIQNLTGFILNIMKELIQIMKKKLIKLGNLGTLIILTNIKFIQMHLIHDISDEIFIVFQVGPDINRIVIKEIITKAINEITEKNVLELKKSYTEQNILSIYNDILNNFLSEAERNNQNALKVLFNNDESKIDAFLKEPKDYLRNYDACIQSEEEMQIRIYMVDILSNYAKMFCEIKQNASFYADEIMKNIILFTTMLFLKPLKLLNNISKEKIRQIWLEIEFFQVLTTKFHTQNSLKNCYEICLHLKRIYNGGNAELEEVKNIEIFDEEQKNMKKKLIRNGKYKLQNNLQCLLN